MFHDGCRKTYTTAKERNIPLVSMQWIEVCKAAKKVVDHINYPPIGIEEYLKPKLKFNTPVSFIILLSTILVKYVLLVN